MRTYEKKISLLGSKICPTDALREDMNAKLQALLEKDFGPYKKLFATYMHPRWVSFKKGPQVASVEEIPIHYAPLVGIWYLVGLVE